MYIKFISSSDKNNAAVSSEAIVKLQCKKETEKISHLKEYRTLHFYSKQSLKSACMQRF